MAAKRILLGITGGIAAYKSAELVRLLKKAGLEVRVVMTRGAEAFITPLTFQALSGEPVRTSLLDPEAEAGMGHIELAKWADQVVVAPASADFLARLAQVAVDDLLTTVLCYRGADRGCAGHEPGHVEKFPHPTQRAAALRRSTDYPVGPDQGEQACGDTGPGRMRTGPGRLVMAPPDPRLRECCRSPAGDHCGQPEPIDGALHLNRLRQDGLRHCPWRPPVPGWCWSVAR